MPGLLERYLGERIGARVWSEPERAGRSSMVLEETDLDAAAACLTDVGIVHDGPAPGGGARVLMPTDLDGNRVIPTGT